MVAIVRWQEQYCSARKKEPDNFSAKLSGSLVDGVPYRI